MTQPPTIPTQEEIGAMLRNMAPSQRAELDRIRAQIQAAQRDPDLAGELTGCASNPTLRWPTELSQSVIDHLRCVERSIYRTQDRAQQEAELHVRNLMHERVQACEAHQTERIVEREVHTVTEVPVPDPVFIDREVPAEVPVVVERQVPVPATVREIMEAADMLSKGTTAEACLAALNGGRRLLAARAQARSDMYALADVVVAAEEARREVEQERRERNDE